MSRSFRKFPLFDGGTKRWGKQHSSRITRHKTKQIIESLEFDIEGWSQDGRRVLGCPAKVTILNDDFLLPKPDEIYDFWWDNDSGCQFDPVRFPELLRK